MVMLEIVFCLINVYSDFIISQNTTWELLDEQLRFVVHLDTEQLLT